MKHKPYAGHQKGQKIHFCPCDLHLWPSRLSEGPNQSSV